jgi:hypothetical protein
MVMKSNEAGNNNVVAAVMEMGCHANNEPASLKLPFCLSNTATISPTVIIAPRQVAMFLRVNLTAQHIE